MNSPSIISESLHFGDLAANELTGQKSEKLETLLNLVWVLPVIGAEEFKG